MQEALTNALKYADGPAALQCASAPATACGSGAPTRSVRGAVARASGLGLPGMAERVALLGGTLTHGPTPDGRFELDGDIPLAGGRAT